MESFVAILHILVALVLIGLVLVQDTKSGSVGVFGGGGSNSVLGATGATTLAQKMTRWSAVVFATTCILLTVFAKRGSVFDSQHEATPAPISVPAGEPAAAAPSGTETQTSSPAQGNESAPAPSTTPTGP